MTIFMKQYELVQTLLGHHQAQLRLAGFVLDNTSPTPKLYEFYEFLKWCYPENCHGDVLLEALEPL
jgi:hypothetical protein